VHDLAEFILKIGNNLNAISGVLVFQKFGMIDILAKKIMYQTCCQDDDSFWAKRMSFDLRNLS